MQNKGENLFSESIIRNNKTIENVNSIRENANKFLRKNPFEDFGQGRKNWIHQRAEQSIKFKINKLKNE